MAVSIGVVDDVCVSATLELLCHLNLAHREKKAPEPKFKCSSLVGFLLLQISTMFWCLNHTLSLYIVCSNLE